MQAAFMLSSSNLCLILTIQYCSILSPTFNFVGKKKLFVLCFSFLIYVTILFNLTVALSKETQKIEEVDSKSKVATPQYNIIREPPDGRPEFLVIEINLPGIVSTCESEMNNYFQQFMKWHSLSPVSK